MRWLLTIIQIMMGMPMKAVTELTGSTIPLPGSIEIRSQASMTMAPVMMQAKNRIRWSAVWKSIRQMWGTAIQMNPMGPQKAVTLPARMPVLKNRVKRAVMIFTPKLRA